MHLQFFNSNQTIGPFSQGVENPSLPLLFRRYPAAGPGLTVLPARCMYRAGLGAVWATAKHRLRRICAQVYTYLEAFNARYGWVRVVVDMNLLIFCSCYLRDLLDGDSQRFLLTLLLQHIW